MLLRFGAVLLLLGSLPLAAQTRSSPWTGQVLLGASRALVAEPLGTGLTLSIGVGRALGASTAVSLDGGRLWLGSRAAAGFRDGFPPYFPSGFFREEASQGLWHLGLRLDQRLFRAPVTPTFLVSLGAYGLHGGYQYTLRDSVTSEVVRRTDTRGTYWGPACRLA